MSHDTPIDDGYEENPWADDPPGERVPVKDFLPPAAMLRNAIMHVRPNGVTMLLLPDADRIAIEHQATRQGTTPSEIIASVLHDYVSGQLVKRS